MNQEQELKKIFGIKDYPQRTLRQNAALHLFFTLMAEALNEAGYDQRVVLKPSVPISWDPKAVKEKIFKPLMKAVVHKESTTELDTTEITKVWEELNRHFGTKFHVHVPFPTEEQLEDYLKQHHEKRRRKSGLSNPN